jgi:hypothetical protein
MALFSTALLSALLVGATASQIVRRHGEEQDLVSMYLNSDGDAVQLIREAVNVPDNTMECSTDFIFGVADSSNCSDPARHEIILDSGLCIQAATLTGALADHQTFHVNGTLRAKDSHPKGCFSGPCIDIAGNTTSGTCFFYNNIGDMPLHPVGTPVCSRPRYMNGTANTNGHGADCPANYSVIMDEDRCREVAACMGHAQGEPFDHGTGANNSKHDDFPNGCFIGEHSKVYFNHDKQGYGEPRAPRGTPLCNVTQSTKCTGGSCSVVDR